jgi:hypothetical protein
VSTPGGTPADLDPALARAWREASGDEPPGRLDDAIRAAARRAVQAGPHPAGRSFVQRWRVPLAIAALLVVSASLTLMISERDAHLPTAAQAPAAAEASKQAAPAAGTIAQQPPSAPPERAQSRVRAAGTPTTPPAAAPAGVSPEAAERKDAGEAAGWREADSPDAALRAVPSTAEPAASANVEAPAPAAPAMREEAAPIAREETAPVAREEAAPAGAGAARVTGAEPADELRKKRESASDFESIMREAQTSDEAEQPPGRARLKLQARPSAPAALRDAEPAPEQWIDRIRELRRQGHMAEAEASLEQFRERYPDFALPADLAPPREH